MTEVQCLIGTSSSTRADRLFTFESRLVMQIILLQKLDIEINQQTNEENNSNNNSLEAKEILILIMRQTRLIYMVLKYDPSMTYIYLMSHNL